MARLIPILIVVLVVVLVASAFVGKGRGATSTRIRTGRPTRTRPGGYRYAKRTDQAKRRVKGVAGPAERRADIAAWLDTHEGVEAYVEPKTATSHLSVVFVDDVGEWRRFELREDAIVRQFAAERGFPVYDAGKIGYPSRMRRPRGEADDASEPRA